ncbi:MAG: hypothetical protein HOW73_20320 [Polyangiaceae bacterium]|nr:hypothetical protein [Polyangiaceae bacterium]
MADVFIVGLIAGLALGGVIVLSMRLRGIHRAMDANNDRFANCINELSRRTGGTDLLRKGR